MVPELVHKGRRRCIWNDVLAQSANVLSGAFGALILLLLAGTQVLDWHWLIALPVATLGTCLYRVWKRRPSPYTVAQMLDRRGNLADTLSTAFYFAEWPGKTSPSVRQAQSAEAERMAQGVVLSEALPFTMPRGIYAMCLLGAIASSLLALRYAIDRRLDLHAPLPTMVRDVFGGGASQRASLDAKRKLPRGSKLPNPEDALGLTVPDGEERQANPTDPAPDSALDTVGVPDVDNDKGNGQPEAKSKGQSPGSERAEGEQDGLAGEEGDSKSGGEGPAEGQKGTSAGNKNDPSGGQQASDSNGDNSSLMTKLKDAMSSLLSRMKQPPAGGSQQQAGNQQSKQSSGKQGKGEQGSSGQGQQRAGNDGSQEGQDGQSQAGEAQDGQNAQGKGQGQSADQQASNQPGSGMGKQDGSKDVKLAEQLAAMGKISEIIGKRSANLTGEITVEVQQSNQQIKTPYAKNTAQHGESGGEISRDEVPVMFQTYVQQYFEQVRKAEAAKPAKPGAAKAN